jgi:Na+/melibiose symporter-like transporter
MLTLCRAKRVGYGTMTAMPQWSGFRLAMIAVLWLAWNAQWVVIPVAVIPQAVNALVPDHPELWTGLVVAAGAVVAMIVPPVAGALSDRSRNPSGRRRPYLVAGVLASCVALVFFGWAESAGLAALLVAYLLLQFWWNWGAGPFAGLIPDLVPSDQHGAAAGWMNALGIVGTIMASVALWTYRPGHAWPLVCALVVVSLSCLGLTLIFIKEPAPGQPPPWQGLARFARSFYLPLAENRDFYLVLATRLLNQMGVWSVLTFLVLYLQFVVGLGQREANHLMVVLTAAGAVLAIGASFASARLIHRHGVVRTVQASSWVMALTAASYALIAVAPRLPLVAPLVLVFAIANGVFGASDWALALAVLPSGQDAGKDFGIWHICLVLPQVVGPVTTGVLITVAKRAVSAPFAYGLAFGVAAVWFVAASVFIGKLRLQRDS